MYFIQCIYVCLGEDDHNDRFCDENSFSEGSNVAEDINLDLFEE